MAAVPVRPDAASPAPPTSSDAVRGLPVVRAMEADGACAREASHWPLGRLKRLQAPETLVHGALAGPGHFGGPPLTFRWTGRGLPGHVDAAAYCRSIQEPAGAAGLRVPGVSVVHWLGPGLALGAARGAVHAGVAAMLLDEAAARASFANSAGAPSFTANLHLEHLRPLRAWTAVVADAWVTCIDGRKTSIASRLVDAQDGRTLVRAQSLFVSAP
ncbi:hypothetical protein H4R18_002539 [Coemansia javaensis]|uniref:Thioesterase domain-containing protein n=1 Tax=Coemansia javaensis TaxID=2761396 RepID=A0A9W8HI29_9FUNG|nr:hypothetical protein H4R18_002539 [Coemansia javaensis]